MDSMSLTCSVARKAVIRNTHKGHQGGLAQEYRASFKQVQRSRMAALRATLRAKARASVPALRQLERRPVFLHCRALPQKLSLWLNTSNSLNPCTRKLRISGNINIHSYSSKAGVKNQCFVVIWPEMDGI